MLQEINLPKIYYIVYYENGKVEEYETKELTNVLPLNCILYCRISNTWIIKRNSTLVNYPIWERVPFSEIPENIKLLHNLMN